MPLFEYRCRECNKLFEKIVTSTTAKISCKFCQSTKVKKTISTSSYRISGSKGGGPPAGALSGCSTSPGFS